MLASFLSGEFLLNIPCWYHFYLGSFSDTSHLISVVSLTYPVLPSFLCVEFLLHIPCCLHFYADFFLDIPWCLGFFFFFFFFFFLISSSRAGFIFIWGVSVTHPVLALILLGDFLLQIPFWLLFYHEIFLCTFRAGFIFMQGISLTHPMLSSFLCMESV